MTTIAYDSVSLAVDRQWNLSGTRYAGSKIFRCGNYIYACTGHIDEIAIVREWLEDGADRKLAPTGLATMLGIVFDLKQRKAFTLEGNKKTTFWPIECKYYAAGSGAEYALAAMHLGKTAAEAVEFAGKLNTTTGMGVDVILLSEAQ